MADTASPHGTRGVGTEALTVAAGEAALDAAAPDDRALEDALHFRRVVESLFEAVAVLSPDGRAHYANERAAELLGVSVPGIVERPFPPLDLELVDVAGAPVDRSSSVAVRAVRSGCPVGPEVRGLQRADGSLRWLEVVAAPLSRHPGSDPYAAVVCFRDVTVERDAARRQAAAERRLHALLGHVAEGYLVLDAVFRVREASASIDRFWSVAEIVGADASSLVHADDATTLRQAFARACASEPAARHVEVRLARPRRAQDPAGQSTEPVAARWVEVGLTNCLDDPSLRGVVVTLRDVTDRKLAERARRFAEERFRLGFEHGTAGMSITDPAGRILEVNPALCDLLGEQPESMVGTMIAEWVHPGDREERRAQRTRMFAGEFDRYRAERRYLRRDGTTIWCLMTVSLIRDDDGRPQYLFSQFQDISERKANEVALEHGVHHDALTGLPNRRGLLRRLEESLARIPSEGSVAVLFLDVDRFKVVNDGLGHAAGDRILVEIAHRLGRGVRAGDTVARFGGDEFIVVCEQVCELEEAEALARRTLALFDEPFDVHGKPLSITASCGIVLVEGGTTAEEALRDADAAMYSAKEQGRGRPQVFDEHLRRVVRDRLDVEQALRLALDRGELFLVYQPVVEVESGRTVGVEALVRWAHPERGTIPPAEFIPAAEESGLIVPIGDLVLTEAVAQVAGWRRARPDCRDLWVAVNLSQRQFVFGDPLESCARALAAAGATPDLLRVELTESTVMDDVDAAVRVLGALRGLGVGVAIDDFGTGYSSLAYLSRLPVSQLKIDRSFVAGIGTDPNAHEIIRAIGSLARAMGLETCAEGVERPDQLDVVAGLQCELAQGFLWAPPLSPAELEAFVASQPYGVGGA